MEYEPIAFIGEEIAVEFVASPALAKKPGCPDAMLWRETRHAIVARLAEWHDYRRRGRMARNMRAEHAARAAQRGSWGVGRDFYRVRTREGRIFEIYYDRAPRDAYRRGGSWHLFRELRERMEQ
ncbi:MAG: hypothetical protein GF330_06035 [Candidatus Eisenbacteria bacterium]|nr:hypothetical protein [Candidatus Eisenbacteria bacterium]